MTLYIRICFDKMSTEMRKYAMFLLFPTHITSNNIITIFVFKKYRIIVTRISGDHHFRISFQKNIGEDTYSFKDFIDIDFNKFPIQKVLESS